MFIKVHVKSRAKQEVVIEAGPDLLKISVKEPARGNRANDRIIEILRARFPKKVIRLVKGHQAPHKIVSID